MESFTAMKLTVTQEVNEIRSAVMTLVPGIHIINKFQIALISSPNELSGTKIVTNKPVTVFSGHEFSSR